MENNQEIRDLIASLAVGMARLNDLLNGEHRGVETNEDTDQESEANAPEVPVVAEDEEESLQGDGGAEVNEGLAGLLGELNFTPQYRSQVQVINGEVIAVGYGYDRNTNTYTSEGGIVHDMSGSPPGRCFNCGGNHWRKDCHLYYNRRNDHEDGSLL